jgi:broad specificity phosphatase PhoE
VRERSMKALEGILEKHGGECILLSAHQVINKVLVCAMLGLDNSHFWHIKQDNGCLNIFEYSGKFITHLINDTCHLS